MAKAEQDEDVRPELSTQIENMDQYDIIFLGYSCWHGDMPMALYSFLDAYDLSGKKIIPFVTSGGSGFSDTRDSIKNAEPDAGHLEGLSLKGTDVKDADAEIIEWLDRLNLINLEI